MNLSWSASAKVELLHVDSDLTANPQRKVCHPPVTHSRLALRRTLEPKT